MNAQRASVASTRVAFRILGPLEVLVAERPVALGSPKERALLALLLWRGNEAIPVGRLIDELWPERPPSSARHAVQVYVSRLRRALGERQRITARSRAYALRVEADEVDLARFRALLEQGRSALANEEPEQVAELLREALALWRGRALADLDGEPGVRDLVLALEEERLEALELRIEADLASGRHAELVAELEGLIGEYPAREALYRQLMLALYRSGRQADALQTYRRGRDALLHELGLEPSAELKELEAAILRQDPALTIEPPELRARRHLPAQPNAFIGRAHELEELVELVGSRAARLVTLTGPGGAGKTRLALAAAERVAASFRDGVWFVGLGSLSDPALVPAAIARAVGVSARPPHSLEEALADHLRERELLLVTDTWEHLLDAATTLSELLRQAPRLSVVATSRSSLDLYGEHVYDVPPLALPDARERDLEKLERSDAVALFVERARAADRLFAVATGNARVVAQICTILDGLPLALELAAARLRALSLEDVAAGLARPLELVGGGPRDVPARQRTLRATIEWSYGLLAPNERALFDRLAVFAAPFTVEAARTICGADVKRLNRLAQKNLLRAGADGVDRYRMLDTIREFALARLESSGGVPGLRARHAEFFADLGAGCSRMSDDAAIRRLEADLPDLRAALAWLYAAGEYERAAALALDLQPLPEQAGYTSEGRAWLEPAVRDAAKLTAGQRWRVLFSAAVLASHQTDIDTAKKLANRSLEVCREAGDKAAEATVLAHCSWFELQTGDFTAAERLAEQALAAARITGEVEPLIRATISHGAALQLAGKLDQCRRATEEAVELGRAMGSRRYIVAALANLTELDLLEGRYDDAVRHGAEAVELGDGVDRHHDALARANFALAQLLAGGSPLHAASELGKVLAFFSDLGDVWVCGAIIEAISAAAAADGRHREASVLAGAAASLAESTTGEPYWLSAVLFERILVPARSVFGEEEWDGAEHEGRRLTCEQAVERALAFASAVRR